MSQQQQPNDSKTPTAIKIAAKEASQRNSSGGPADPGPGDPSAAPSVAPQLVDIPPAPTPSELVVKSLSQAPLGSSRASGSAKQGSPSASQGLGLNSAKSTAIATLHENRSGSSRVTPSPGPKSAVLASMSGNKSDLEHTSQMGPAASNPSVGAPREPTSSRPLTGPPDALLNSIKSSASRHETGSKAPVSGLLAKSNSGLHRSSNLTSHKPTSTGSHKSTSGVPASLGSKRSNKQSGSADASAGLKSKSGHGSSIADQSSGTANRLANAGSVGTAFSAKVASPAETGAIHDEDEEGEGEVEVPDNSPVAAGSMMGKMSSKGPGSQVSLKAKQASHSGSAIDASPSSSAGGASKMSTKTGRKSTSPAPSTGASEPGSSKAGGAESTAASLDPSKSKKKVTKFRYHKRITVHTSGKTDPSAVMSKVNKKEHRPNLTPSTIDVLDPQELLKHAGIKNADQSHWRVRLRQTKRTTHNGKTTTQTKIAYRDSDGNKRVKTSTSPFCKMCGKKLELCRCDASSQH